jgi:hypothetical protein
MGDGPAMGTVGGASFVGSHGVGESGNKHARQADTISPHRTAPSMPALLPGEGAEPLRVCHAVAQAWRDVH